MVLSLNHGGGRYESDWITVRLVYLKLSGGRIDNTFLKTALGLKTAAGLGLSKIKMFLGLCFVVDLFF